MIIMTDDCDIRPVGAHIFNFFYRHPVLGVCPQEIAFISEITGKILKMSFLATIESWATYICREDNRNPGDPLIFLCLPIKDNTL